MTNKIIEAAADKNALVFEHEVNAAVTAILSERLRRMKREIVAEMFGVDLQEEDDCEDKDEEEYKDKDEAEEEDED